MYEVSISISAHFISLSVLISSIQINCYFLFFTNNFRLGPKLKDFKAALANGAEAYPELTALGKEVTEFARSFPTIGFTE